MSRVCFFGAWDPGYPRNRVMRDGLARAGHQVIETRAPVRRAWRRYPELAAAFARAGRAADVVLVPEFRHKDVPLARLLAGARPLVFDPLVSRYDTVVGDWALHAPGSLQARWNLHVDRWTLGLADVVICDTWAHGALYASLGVRRARLRRVLVGAEQTFFEVPPPPREAAPVRVLYAGGFLPLHGVPVLLEAVAWLERRGGPPFELELLGEGIEYPRCRTLAAGLGLERVRFLGRTPYARLPEALGSAHVVAGAFGAGPKAGRVIPHKVYQGLAAGRAVVTGDGEGVREVFADGEHLALAPRGDAEALAETLGRVIADADLRARLAAGGRARACAVASPQQIGAALSEVLAGGGAPLP